MINFILIHCDEHINRLELINKNVKNFNYPIEIFKGIYNNESVKNKKELFNLIKKYNKDFIYPSGSCARTPGSIGCYLSHNLLIKNILNNYNKYSDYIVILEDDVILNKKFYNDIFNIVNTIKNNNINFDVCYLNSIQKLNNKIVINEKNKIINNIYKIDPKINIFSTAAMLINKKNIKKIYNETLDIRHEIDSQYRIMSLENKLNVLYIVPKITKINNKLKSNIN